MMKRFLKIVDTPAGRQIFPYSICCGAFMGWQLVHVIKYGASMIGFWYFFIVLILGSLLLHYCYK